MRLFKPVSGKAKSVDVSVRLNRNLAVEVDHVYPEDITIEVTIETAVSLIALPRISS